MKNRYTDETNFSLENMDKHGMEYLLLLKHKSKHNKRKKQRGGTHMHQLLV